MGVAKLSTFKLWAVTTSILGGRGDNACRLGNSATAGFIAFTPVSPLRDGAVDWARLGIAHALFGQGTFYTTVPSLLLDIHGTMLITRATGSGAGGPLFIL